MTDERLEQEAFERGFYDIPEPCRFWLMSQELLRWHEAQSEAGSRRQIAFAEHIAWRERWAARLWAAGLLALGPLLQAILKYLGL